MNEEEKELINNIERALNLSEVKGDLVTIIYNYIVKATINLINKLQKKLEQEKEKNKKLNLENQALFESINCNDDNMLAIRYSNLQKELDKKDKVIDLMAEYLNENNREFWTDDIEETKQYFYKKVEEENE